MAWIEIGHANSNALANALATRLATVLDAALVKRGVATLALAGGRTAPPVMKRLAGQARDWRQVTLLPTDERWVDAGHVDCNLRQLQSSFESRPEIHWISLAPAMATGEVDASHANAGLATIAATDFDSVLLGMGIDGHFASLFSGASGLGAGLDLDNEDSAIAITPNPMPDAGPHPRISLTLARLLRSCHVMLAIVGADKRGVLDTAMQENDPTRLPVAALLHAPGTTVEIHWSP